MQSSTRLFHVFHHRAKLVETKKLLDQAATWALILVLVVGMIIAALWVITSA
ncbi:MAG: hypothetical protein WAL52_06360 [Candidatus Sulfotelmatobacter sp.]